MQRYATLERQFIEAANADLDVVTAIIEAETAPSPNACPCGADVEVGDVRANGAVFLKRAAVETPPAPRPDFDQNLPPEAQAATDEPPEAP